ncbi:MAG: EamA family transporter RarD [Actinomycetota bacterium]|nr:EamA family transporter RarD [Actinomycetota bacterium]
MREPREHSEEARGFALGAAAYGLWGLFPLYWPLLKPAGAIEILAHRVTWSLISMVVLVVALRRTGQLRAIFRNPRVFRLLVLASVVVAVNWGTYIWGVNHGLVVETSLGYFINPLVTVMMGVLILKERLRGWQWAAIGIAFVAVVGLTLDYGQPPWVALILAFSFGTYGLAKKQANAGAIESLTFETMVLTPLALGYLVWLTAAGEGHFLGHGAGHALLLAGTGVVTAIPLICFGGAAIRVPMTTLGLLQYLAPVIQFVIGVTIVHESMTAVRWAGFGLVWIALAVFTVDALHHRQRQLRLAAEASAI